MRMCVSNCNSNWHIANLARTRQIPGETIAANQFCSFVSFGIERFSNFSSHQYIPTLLNVENAHWMFTFSKSRGFKNVERSSWLGQWNFNKFHQNEWLNWLKVQSITKRPDWNIQNVAHMCSCSLERCRSV